MRATTLLLASTLSVMACAGNDPTGITPPESSLAPSQAAPMVRSNPSDTTVVAVHTFPSGSIIGSPVIVMRGHVAPVPSLEEKHKRSGYLVAAGRN